MAEPLSAELTRWSPDEHGDNHFEKLAKVNGTRYWMARDLMRELGYENWSHFKKVVNRAIAACLTLNISVAENFIQQLSTVDGKPCEDFKLSRFACCLTTLNGDPKKPLIAAAQAYFISLSEVLHDIRLDAESVDRIVVREEISEREITVSEAAAAHGVRFYDRFQNAGYRGLYNMDYGSLKQLKGIPDVRRSLLDFMGRDELAANLFRLTLTEGRIRRENTRGQSALEEVAEQVGRRVRKDLIEETGISPESLPIAQDVLITRRGLKQTNKAFIRSVDNLDQQRLYEEETLAEITGASRECVPECPDCAAGNPYSHFGAVQCSSGSLASGGSVAHCNCDYCSHLS